MDKRKIANKQVKDRLLAALITFSGQKDWSKVTVTELIAQAGVARASFYRNFASVEDIIEYGIHEMTEAYHQGKPFADEDFHQRAVMVYKFRFYQEHADLILAFHRAKASQTLLDLITDCEIAENGDMPAASLAKYKLYYYSGAFYNMLICWLEGGTKESPEAMADEFLRLSGGLQSPS